MSSSQSHQLEDGRPPGGTSRSPHTKPSRKVQWLDERGSQVAHTLDEHGLDPVAFGELTTALERHHSLSPLQTKDHLPRSEKEEDSLGLLTATTTSSGTASLSSRDSSPRPQPRIPGNFIGAHETAGLPGITDSDGYARTEAARVVRSHTRKGFAGLGRKRRVGPNKKGFIHRKKTEVEGDHLTSGSGLDTDVEHDAALSTSPRQMGGGVLSALLGLYNQHDTLTPSTPESLPLELPPEEPKIQRSNTTEKHQRGRPLSMPSTQPSPASTSRGSSADSRDSHHREGNRRKRSKSPFAPSMLFSARALPQAKSGAGVIGPLIAGTGNLTGMASPASSALQPNVKRPGYHLSRYTLNAKNPEQEPNAPRPLSMASESHSLPGSKNSSPPSPPSPDVSEPTNYKTKWTSLIKDLPYTGSLSTFGGRSGTSTPGGTPSPTLEGEEYFETKKRLGDDGKKQKKHKRKKAEVFITRHVAKIIQRQEFILKLGRAMMMFGGPSHRLQSQIRSAAHVLEIELSCLYLPDVLLVSFDDSATSTSSVKLIRQASALDLGKLDDAYKLYWKVIHDNLSVADASGELDALMRRPQMYSWWKLVFFGGMCSASICSVSFNGSFIDSLIVFPLGALLVAIQLLSVRNELYSNIFEVTMTTLFSFITAALASSHHFCYSAVASSSIVLILPGFIVLCGALEIMSRNMVAGSVRLCYAVVYAIFLGYGLAMGNEAFEKLSGTTVFAPEDYTCSMTHDAAGPWYQRTPPKLWAFLTVPMYSLFLSLKLQAPYNRKETPLLVAISCIGWVITYFTGTKFVGQSDIIAAVGAFSISIISNLHARFFSGNAFAIMITGILFQVPSGLGNGGLLNYATQQTAGSTTSYISGFQTALNLVSVAIGLTVGLGISLAIMYPIQSKRRAGGVFSL